MDANISEGPSLAQVMKAIKDAEILSNGAPLPRIGELTECLRRQDWLSQDDALDVYRARLVA